MIKLLLVLSFLIPADAYSQAYVIVPGYWKNTTPHLTKLLCGSENKIILYLVEAGKVEARFESTMAVRSEDQIQVLLDKLPGDALARIKGMDPLEVNVC
jgi:hypothetical protein